MRPVITYDESRWPYVVVTLPPVELTDDEFAAFMAKLKELGRRPGSCAFVLDVRSAVSPNAARRRIAAEVTDELARQGGASFGMVIVLTSATTRAIFKAISWLRQGTYPFSAASSVEEGIRWLREQTRPTTRKAN